MLQITKWKKQKKTCSTGKMNRGILNVKIEKAFEKLNDENINDKFVGVFPANHITLWVIFLQTIYHINRFISYKTITLEKKGKYPFIPFIIANTNSSEKDGTHWWNIMDICPRIREVTYFFFFFWFVQCSLFKILYNTGQSRSDWQNTPGDWTRTN